MSQAVEIDVNTLVISNILRIDFYYHSNAAELHDTTNNSTLISFVLLKQKKEFLLILRRYDSINFCYLLCYVYNELLGQNGWYPLNPEIEMKTGEILRPKTFLISCWILDCRYALLHFESCFKSRKWHQFSVDCWRR